jgi:hypothetical protein
LEKNADRRNPFSELYYETFNNMARAMNILGDIKKSLYFLEKAMEHVQLLAQN